jgi:pimeloyl-ACP methyl ester carboxylesterase
MSDIRTSEGITSQMVQTDRLNTHVLSSGPEDGTPVVFLHGNFSAATYWEDTMLALPAAFHAIAPDLRGYGWSEDKLVDGTRGMRDWSDDLAALLATLGIEKAHMVGWSLGAGVLYRFLIDHAQKALAVTLVSPVSPYGFGGTKGIEGLPCYDDFAGSGGGVVNPEFVRRIKEGDRSEEDPNSPRNVINSFYYVAPFRATREEEFLTASLAEKMGDDRYPGDFVPSENWPNVAPGRWGPINAGSPKYVLDDVPALLAIEPKPPILWIRGSHDMIVSDNSMFDFGALGKMELVPGWPGEDIYPPQPMVSQTRDVLKQYAANGGSFEEHVIQDTAHGPHIEKPDEFNALFHGFIG